MKHLLYSRPLFLINFLIIISLQLSYGQSFMDYAQSGKTKYEQKDYAGALEDFNKAIELSPNISEMYYRRGLAKYFLKDYQGAADDYSQAVSLDPQNTDAYFERAYTKYNHLNDKEGSVDDYTRVLTLNPQYATAYNNRGLARSDLKDYQGAVQDYNQAIQLRPNFPVAYSNRGLAKYEMKDYDGALQDLDVAFQDKGYTNAWSMNYRGLAKYQKGEVEEALKDFEAAVKMDSTYGVYHYNVGYMKNELGDTEGACKAWRVAASLGYEEASTRLSEICGGDPLAALNTTGNYLYVKDGADILYGTQRDNLENKLKNYNDTTSTQIAIVTIPSLNGENLEAYAIKLAQELGIGQKGKDNGLMILVSKNDRKIRIEVGYGIEGVITDLVAKDLIDHYLSPNFKQQKFYDGFDQTTDAIIKLLEGEFNADDISNGKGSKVKSSSSSSPVGWILALAFGIPFVIILIIAIAVGGGGGSGGGTYSSSGSSYYSSSSSSSSWSSSSSSSSSWSSGSSSSSFGGGSFGGGGASGGW